MPTEQELRWYDIDPIEIKNVLKDIGAEMTCPRTLISRHIFRSPADDGIKIVRIRDDPSGPSLTYKFVHNDKSKFMEEIETHVESYKNTHSIMSKIFDDDGSYQESYREEWKYRQTMITIDEWPKLKPLIEIEGPSMDAILEVSNALKIDPDAALKGSVAHIYEDIGIKLSNIKKLAFDEVKGGSRICKICGKHR